MFIFNCGTKRMCLVTSFTNQHLSLETPVVCLLEYLPTLSGNNNGSSCRVLMFNSKERSQSFTMHLPLNPHKSPIKSTYRKMGGSEATGQSAA